MSLTPRQHTIVQLLCAGLNTKQIARRLGIVPTVVSNHLLAIRKANGLKNVAQIGMAAVLDGVVSLPPLDSGTEASGPRIGQGAVAPAQPPHPRSSRRKLLT